MKKLFLLLIIFFATSVISCEKKKYENTGIITGSDMTMCACCGGYLIEIDGNKYRFEKAELPSGFTFVDTQLPLTVELNWELKTGVCTGFNWIKISDIKKM
jgi:hypothetical protein